MEAERPHLHHSGTMSTISSAASSESSWDPSPSQSTHATEPAAVDTTNLTSIRRRSSHAIKSVGRRMRSLFGSSSDNNNKGNKNTSPQRTSRKSDWPVSLDTSTSTHTHPYQSQGLTAGPRRGKRGSIVARPWSWAVDGMNGNGDFMSGGASATPEQMQQQQRRQSRANWQADPEVQQATRVARQRERSSVVRPWSWSMDVDVMGGQYVVCQPSAGGWR